jgi:hypothetical protein
MADTNFILAVAKRQSRRYTTIEGWRELGSNIYGFGGAIVSVDPQFDLERYDDPTLPTRISKVQAHRHVSRVSFNFAGNEINYNPFDDSNAIVPNEPEPDPPQPYHVFSRSQKWLVVINIGIAGMFSGLSSNIYFPSLDAIARVSSMAWNI